MAKDPTIIDTSVEILMKSTERAESCPDELRCQLELFENSEEENPSLIVEDTAEELEKNIQVFLKNKTGGCDYALNVGMVGGLPEEYILVRVNIASDYEIVSIFDIAKGQTLDIENFENFQGSPDGPASLPYIMEVAAPATGQLFYYWFNYNFNPGTTNVTTQYSSSPPETPCSESVQYPDPWTRSYTTGSEDLDGDGDIDNYDNSWATVTLLCNYDTGKRRHETFYHHGDTLVDDYTRNVALPNYSGYDIRDSNGGSADIRWNLYFTKDMSVGGVSGCTHHDTTDITAKVGNSGTIEIYSESISWSQGLVYDDVPAVASGEKADFSIMGIGPTWNYRVQTGLEYVVSLGGCALGGGKQVASLSPTGWASGNTDCGVPYPPTDVNDTWVTLRSVCPVPSVVLLSDIDIDPETDLISVSECINKSMKSKNNGLAACIKSVYDVFIAAYPDVDSGDLTYALNYGPTIELYKKGV